MELKSRIINGKKSDTHFLYTDKKGVEWSVVDFEKLMTKPPMGDFFDNNGMTHSQMFGYKWEGMTFQANKESQQVCDMTVEGVIEQIEDLLTAQLKGEKEV